MTLLSRMNLTLCAAGAAALFAATTVDPEDSTRPPGDALDRHERAAAVAAVLARLPAPRPGPDDAPSYGSRYRPWTPAWTDHCRGLYRSFDPATGFHLGLDGEPVFCRAEPNLARPGH